jgi:hypothetical protein
MENNNIICNRLMKENEELKRTLALSLNKPLIQKLSNALERINNGQYVTEEEFFRS